MWNRLRTALPRLLAGAAALLLVLVGRFCVLVLVNLQGPLPDAPRLALLLALLAAALSATLFYGVGRLLLRLAPAVGIGFALAGVAAGWLLAPTVCDTHESWVDRPNQRCTCRGWSFRYYPPGVMDASSDDYCVGWEQPVAAAPP